VVFSCGLFIAKLRSQIPMDEQLALFNPIDLAPLVPVTESAGPVMVRPVMPAPAPAPPRQYKAMDMVVILPFKDSEGRDRGAFLKTPGVVLGYNPVGMVLVDVGTPGVPYAAEEWRVVSMDD
jgi:hypothetical protein